MRIVKRVGYIICIIFLWISSDTVSFAQRSYGATRIYPANFYDTPLIPFVTMEDIYALNAAYQQKPKMHLIEAQDILMEKHQQYTDSIYAESSYVFHVVDEDGNVEFVCDCLNDTGAGSYTTRYMNLRSFNTNDIISLNQTKEELDAYVEMHNESKTQYAEMHADNVELLKYLWENLETLMVVGVIPDDYRGGAYVFGLDEEAEFRSKIPEEIGCHILYVEEKDKDMLERTTVSTFMEGMRECVFAECDEIYWQQMETCMERLVKEYPEYSFDNLYLLAHLNPDYEEYVNFDQELEHLVEDLEYYPNTDNPFDEERYGDSEHIALKRLLSKYKELYPEESYQALYVKYVQEMAENLQLSQNDKRARYLWKTMSIEQKLKAMPETGDANRQEKNQSALYAVLGAGAVCMIGTGFLVSRKKRK